MFSVYADVLQPQRVLQILRKMAVDLETQHAVHSALEQAMSSGQWVVVVLGGDLSKGTHTRTVEGRPVCFLPLADGRERLVLEVSHGATEQLVLVDRISRVIFKAPA